MFSYMGFLLSVQTLLTLEGFLEKHFICVFCSGSIIAVSLHPRMTTDWCFEYKVDQNRIISMHIYTLVYKDGNNETGYMIENK